MGIFGRTVSTKDEHEKDLEKALELKKQGEVGKLSKKRSSMFGSQKGDGAFFHNADEINAYLQ
jgi:hypothetical protein